MGEIRQHGVTMLRDLSATAFRLPIREAILVDWAADEIELLRERLAAAEAVIAEHDRARATVSPPPCACPAHIAWRQRSGR